MEVPAGSARDGAPTSARDGAMPDTGLSGAPVEVLVEVGGAVSGTGWCGDPVEVLVEVPAGVMDTERRVTSYQPS